MNSFIQEYGRTIVAVIIILAFIAFATVYGDTVTGGVKSMADDFFAKSGVETSDEYSLSWTNNGNVKVTKGQNLLMYRGDMSAVEDMYYDADYDGNWYKLSDDPYMDKELYCKWTVKDDPRFLGSLAGQTFEGAMYKVSTNKGCAWVIPGVEMGLIESVPEEYTYKSGNLTITLSPGLYVYDFCAAAFEESAYLEVCECTTETSDVETVEIEGETCIKISSKAFTKEDVVGKTLTLVGKMNGESMSESIPITEEIISEYNGMLTFDGLLISVPNQGVYIPQGFVTGAYGATVSSITIR